MAMRWALLTTTGAAETCCSPYAMATARTAGGIGGMLGPQETPEALAEAVDRMLDPQVRARYASRGLAMASRYPLDHCPSQCAETTAGLLG